MQARANARPYLLYFYFIFILTVEKRMMTTTQWGEKRLQPFTTANWKIEPIARFLFMKATSCWGREKNRWSVSFVFLSRFHLFWVFTSFKVYWTPFCGWMFTRSLARSLGIYAYGVAVGGERYVCVCSAESELFLGAPSVPSSNGIE